LRVLKRPVQGDGLVAGGCFICSQRDEWQQNSTQGSTAHRKSCL
jgi:hypothetical protein